MEPTLFTDVDNSMTIAHEEIFGPVLVVIPFEDDDDAVRTAQRQQLRAGRDGDLGSLDRSLVVAERIRTGSLSINGGVVSVSTFPSAATRSSGIGRRTGCAGFDQYLETKSLAWPAG